MADPMMSALGLSGDLSSPVSSSTTGSGFGTKVTGAFHGVNTVIQGMVSGLTKAASLVSKIKRDMADIAKSAKGAGGLFSMSGPGGAMTGAGGVGASSTLGLGLAPVSGASSTGALITRAGGGGGTLGLGTFGGSKFFSGMMLAGGAAQAMGGFAKMGLGVLGGAYMALPSSTDVLARNRLVSNASFSSAMGASGVAGWATRMSMGLGTSTLDPFQAANVLSSYGYGAGTPWGNAAMAQASGLGFLTGQSITDVAGTLGGQMTNPYMTNYLRLARVQSFNNGKPVGFQSMADQMFTQFGLGGLTPQQVATSLMPGGKTNLNLNAFVPDENMRQLFSQYFQARAKNGGKSIDLGSSNIKSTLNTLTGGTLGAEQATRSLDTSEAEKINTFAKSMSEGIKSGAAAAQSLNDLMTGNAGILRSLANFKANMETFAGSKPGSGAIAAATTAVSGFTDVIKGATAAILGAIGLGGGGALLSKIGGGISGAAGAARGAAGSAMSAIRGAAGSIGSGLMTAVRGTGSFLGSVLSAMGSMESVFLPPIVLDPNMPGMPQNGNNNIAMAGSSNYTAMGGGASGSTGSSANVASSGSAITGYATSFVGTPYKWGGTSTSGWDCSGFVQYVFKKYGVNLPRTSQEQFRVGRSVNYSDAQAGDLLFFHYPGGQDGANHVGIYLGKGKMVQAANSRVGTITSNVDTRHLIGVRRVLSGSVGQGAKPASGANSNMLDSTGTSALTALSLTSLTTGISGVSASSSSILDILNSPTAWVSGGSGTGSPAAPGSSSPGAANTSAGSGDNIMSVLRQAGFSGSHLREAWGVVMAESSGNARAHNTNAGTGDNSYGWFQINMLGAMGPERRRLFHLNSNDQLFDPLTNAKVAYGLSNGGRNWSPWSTWKNGSAQRYMTSAPGYSQGAWSLSQDQVANVHAGEMILPASVAQSVRQSVQRSMAGQGGGGGNSVTIQVYPQNASDDEVLRFARKVEAYLSGKADLASIGAN